MLTRRAFLKSGAATGGVLALSHRLPWTLASATEMAPPDTLEPPRHRIDGLAKVTGQKIFARDFRARDMPGWPKQSRHVLLLRAAYSDRPFLGLDLSALPRPLRPGRIVLAEDLARDHVTSPKLVLKSLLVPRGERAQHVGQPVAILVFDSFRPFADVTRRRGWEPVRYGAPDRSPSRGPEVFGATHYVRVAGTPDDVFSQVRNGPHDPTAVGGEVPEPRRAVNRRAREAADAIARAIAGSGWRVVEGAFSTQVVDPMFLEPEAGLGWWDAGARRMHLVLGSQSPGPDRASVLEMFGDPGCPFRGATIEFTSCYPGGGFGGRDLSTLCLYVALAAAYADGPVRLALSRWEQFQSGIKRHASTISARLAFDARGMLQALESSIALGGGGEPNLTSAVVQLAALSAAGPYRIPRTAISAVGTYTDGAPGGSMRGFGIPQACFAIESLIDDAARALGEDPIRFRLRHVLRRGERDVSGMTLEHHLANVEVCELALQQELWTRREAEKLRRDRPERSYGAGFACCMEAYGTDQDGSVAEVAVTAAGEIVVRSAAVDMGQGSATALAMATAPALGATAARVEMGHTSRFDALGLETGKREADNPRWTPYTFGSSAASMSAFFHTHSVEEAARVVFDHGVLPTAQALWGREPARAGVAWERGRLTAPGLRPLPLPDIAARMYADGRVASAMVHTYFRARFAEADYTVDGQEVHRAIDALGVGRAGRESWTLVTRRRAFFPAAITGRYDRSLYASGGHIVAVEVDRKSGEVKVVAAVSLLDPGEVIHQDLLMGQIEGGFAQGVGYALLEELPAGPAGATGDWNLHRYRVPRPRDLPLGDFAAVLVPPPRESILAGGPRVRKKGIAEVTLTTVAPAVANAVAHAIGRRIASLPITPDKVLKALAER